jgi:hypothetical protein
MIYEERKSCLICKSNILDTLFTTDYNFPLGNFCVDTPEYKFHFMPYNIQLCCICKSAQTKYIGNLDLIYGNNFAGAYGTIRSSHNILFSNFILENKDIKGVVEIGAGNGQLSDIILENKSIVYEIIDPSYAGNREDREITTGYFENQIIKEDKNTIIMSHVFEHFYNPVEIIEKIKENKNIEYVYLSFPDLEKFIKEGSYHVLNPEHIFYIENNFLKDLFYFHNFKCTKTYFHENHSVFFEFTRSNERLDIFPKNISTENDVSIFFKRVIENINTTNLIIEKESDVYIWPCSMHTLFCISLGLNLKKITNVLDNSKLKIDKYLYGYSLLCKSFEKTVNSNETKTIILTGGCYNKEILLQYPNKSFIII